MKQRVLIALAALAIGLAPLGISAAADVPTSGSLPHGGNYVLYRDQTLPEAAIDVWFRAPGAGYDNGSPGIARIAATAAATSTLESGKSLYGIIRSSGGRLTINVYPDIIGISAIVPTTAGRRVIAAMSAAFFSPAIDDTALKTAQRDAAVLSVARRYSSDDLLHDALFAQIFTSGPNHYPPLPETVNEIRKISLADVKTYAKRAFRSANATMSLAGNVDPTWIEAVTAGAPGSADAPIKSTLANAPANTSITGNVAGIGIAWTGPPISDERAATALDFVADYLFRDETGKVAKSVAVESGNYVSGQFITLHDPGVMLVTIGGDKPAELKQIVLGAVSALSTPLDPKAFEAARAAFIYHLAVDTQNPIEQADNLGWYAAEGNASYAPSDPSSSYWQRANTLDPAYVASVVKQYLAHPVIIELTASPASKESAS
ncbi:MAG: insulinase family protein [Candidatus Eremiobacteraeota bacterium]|nr:insulinase family protein [Candidatus Eremiobacteraeota bacterium]